MILLSMLFFYDIFWVFLSTKFTKGGQSVMVAVATGFEAPIKLLMPHISSKNFPSKTCSMISKVDIMNLEHGLVLILLDRHLLLALSGTKPLFSLVT